MQIIGKELNINFLGHRGIAMVVSAVLLLGSLGSVLTRGLDLGVDFTGGVLVEVGYGDSVDLSAVRQTLEAGGVAEAQVQHFGATHEVLIRLPATEGAGEMLATDDDDGADARARVNVVSARVIEVLRAGDPSVELRRVEFVGPQVGEELTEQGGLAMLFALIMIMIYIWLRFEWKFAVGSIAALVHDTVLVVGFFSVTGMGFDLTVLAAVLAVIGYSLNDTIVVFDRIRENFRRMRKGGPEEVMNRSVNQMLPRTMITSMTTLLVLLALFFLGGEVIHAFAAALIVGVLVGTYSSIYIAAAVALMLGAAKDDFMVVEKDDPELARMP